MRSTDALIASGMVDESRMAAAGGSYGGYMASWIAGHTDRFRCIVNHAGVYDTLSQYASDVTQGRAQSFGGERGRVSMRSTATTRRASRTDSRRRCWCSRRARLPRPVTQGLECYGVLKAKGVEARLVYFPDENHWILKPRNSVLWYREVLGWLERFLGKFVARDTGLAQSCASRRLARRTGRHLLACLDSVGRVSLRPSATPTRRGG
jgi:acetyl esterase/lipase